MVAVRSSRDGQLDTAMHDMGSLRHTLQIDLLRDWAYLALDLNVCSAEEGGQQVLR